MEVEKSLFDPYIAGPLGGSLDTASDMQKKVDEFEPIAKVASFTPA